MYLTYQEYANSLTNSSPIWNGSHAILFNSFSLHRFKIHKVKLVFNLKSAKVHHYYGYLIRLVSWFPISFFNFYWRQPSFVFDHIKWVPHQSSNTYCKVPTHFIFSPSYLVSEVCSVGFFLNNYLNITKTNNCYP